MDEPEHQISSAESLVSGESSVSNLAAGGQPPQIPPTVLPPQPPAGLPIVQRDQDVEQIRIISVCYYINAGLTALFACFPIFHLFMGAAMLSGGFGSASMPSHDREALQVMGGMFVGISSLVILGGWIIAVLNFVVARKIVRREARMLCLIVAGINCLNMPLGTALGVFTFIVLSRPQVIRSFEQDHR